MTDPTHREQPVNPFAAPSSGAVGDRVTGAPQRAPEPPDGSAPVGIPPWRTESSYPPPPSGPWGVDSFGRPVEQRRRSRAVRAWLIVPLVIVALVSGAIGGVLGARWSDDQRPSDAALPTVVGASALRGDLTGVAAIAAAIQPSVVTIEVRGPAGESTGSGFVLREDGYLLTNNHVATSDVGPSTITVLFADGTQESAQVVGSTADYDLAVLKIDRVGLIPLPLGDSDAVVVGDPVVAVGAPLGLQGTVTTGIVSALHRPVAAGDASQPAFIDAIQTDAAINPGNSGGPLVDAEGQVIGINSAIAQASGSASATGSIGLGFAIPSNQARRTAEQLIETGTATYPVIGVLLDSRYTGQGVQVSTEAANGAQSVVPDGPADRAGILAGDIILAVDGRPVTQADELIVAIRAKASGDAVTLTVRTGDRTRDVRLVLDEVASG